MNTKIDDYITPEELRLMQNLKGKSRMEKDELIFEYERKKENGYTLRINGTSE